MSSTTDGVTIDALVNRVDSLEIAMLELEADVAGMAEDMDVFWLLMNGVLVFLMQVGFSMLEVGSVSAKNTKAVLIKNVCDASIGAWCWWIVGNSFAYGPDGNGFIGRGNFALQLGKDSTGIAYANWFFAWAFAATSATIVSGAISERVKITGYFIFSVVITAFIHPVVAHWVWNDNGWASPDRKSNLLLGCGAIDFAGSAAVHVVGGVGALVGAVMVKPRSGRFSEDGTINRLPQQSPALQTLGTLILWCGWYGFNAGSTGQISGGFGAVAARAMVNTTIAPASSAVTLIIMVKIFLKKFDSGMVNNGILTGLVAITAGAPLVAPSGAFVIGVLAGAVYFLSSYMLMVRFKVDDVVDAAPVHLFGGILGTVVVGLFTTPENYGLTYSVERRDKCCGAFYGCSGEQLSSQLIFLIVVLVWSAATSIAVFWAIKMTLGLRVSIKVEEVGMDRAAPMLKREASNALKMALNKVGDQSHIASIAAPGADSKRAGSAAVGDLSVLGGLSVSARGGDREGRDRSASAAGWDENNSAVF